jgi:hypothetical protein
LFVKKPCRIEGLLMVMTLALPVYSVTQRRLRQQLAGQQATVPNQLQQPTERPTLRWVFQRLEGIHRVRVTVQGELHDLIEGLNEVTRQIPRLFGDKKGLSPLSNCSRLRVLSVGEEKSFGCMHAMATMLMVPHV